MFNKMTLRGTFKLALLAGISSVPGCSGEAMETETQTQEVVQQGEALRWGGPNRPRPTPARPKPQLTALGVSDSNGGFDESAAEIVAHDPGSQRLFVTNADDNTIDVLDVSDPSAPTELFKVALDHLGGQINSLAVHQGIVAVALEADNKQENGTIAFFDTNGNLLSIVTAGALPDMVTFTPNGETVLVANEGEPSAAYPSMDPNGPPDYSVDPEGTISIIDMRGGAANLTQADVRTASFVGANIAPDVRVAGLGATVAQNIEPEFISVAPNSRVAWVTLQENNAIAVVDIKRAKIRRVFSLGSKDHSLEGNGFDANDEDGPDESHAINIMPQGVRGLFMPDAIATFRTQGRLFHITANEGDSREYGDEDDDDNFYADEKKCGKLDVDEDAAAHGVGSGDIGRLKCITTEGDTDGDGDYDQLYSFGTRSFSIWDRFGSLVFDSGDEIEQTIAQVLPLNFNASDDDPEMDKRSDNKGPEPEGVAIGKVRGRTYAFIGLERIGGVMVYDVTRPRAPIFEQYINTRNFDTEDESLMGDLSPEGMTFIPAAESPNNKALLVVAFEVSGTTRVFQFD